MASRGSIELLPQAKELARQLDERLFAVDRLRIVTCSTAPASG